VQTAQVRKMNMPAAPSGTTSLSFRLTPNDASAAAWTLTVTANQDPKINPLGYTPNLRGSFNSWGVLPMTWDGVRGVFYAYGVQAGPTSSTDPRRFKFGANGSDQWQDQFSLAANGSAAVLTFVGNSASWPTQHYANGADMALPLSTDIADPSATGVTLDFELAPSADGTSATLSVTAHGAEGVPYPYGHLNLVGGAWGWDASPTGLVMAWDAASHTFNLDNVPVGTGEFKFVTDGFTYPISFAGNDGDPLQDIGTFVNGVLTNNSLVQTDPVRKMNMPSAPSGTTSLSLSLAPNDPHATTWTLTVTAKP